MANEERTRMYCHPEFKKLIEMRRIETGETNPITFTKKVSDDPNILKGGYWNFKKDKDDKQKKTFRTPSLF